MTRSEIYTFIEEMEEVGDKWEYDDVKRVYGSDSLEEALAVRKAEVGSFVNIIGKVMNR